MCNSFIAFAFSWATLAKLTFVHLTLAHNQCQWIKLSVALRPDGSLDGCPTVRVEPDARQESSDAVQNLMSLQVSPAQPNQSVSPILYA